MLTKTELAASLSPEEIIERKKQELAEKYSKSKTSKGRSVLQSCFFFVDPNVHLYGTFFYSHTKTVQVLSEFSSSSSSSSSSFLVLLWMFSKSPKASTGGGGKKPKESRVWALGGSMKDASSLDYNKAQEDGVEAPLPQAVYLPDAQVQRLSSSFTVFFAESFFL